LYVQTENASTFSKFFFSETNIFKKNRRHKNSACSITDSEAKQYNTKQNGVLISTKTAQNGRLQPINSIHLFFFDLALPLVVFPDLLCFLLVGIAGGRAKSRVNSDGTKGTDGCLLPNKTLYAPLRCPCFVLGYP
jgi:hypothetical protein